jgi:hypothetical protein
MRIRTITAFFVLLIVCIVTMTGQALGPLPSGWPTRVELGMGDSPGGAAAMKATAPFAFRYQYLAGGVNTGNGWANWNSNGDFARFYIEDSKNNGIIPVFTYYMIYQSSPGGGSESDAVNTNANNTATMTAYYNDLKLFFQKAALFPTQKVVLHVEPDFWGYMQQRTTNNNDNAATVPVKVSETGLPELAGLPSNMSGFARAIVKLRDTIAPNVFLGYHISVWGTGNDIVLSNPSDATVDALATRAANFYSSLGANFDVLFAEFSDRDSAYYQYVYGDNGSHWYDADDFRRTARFLGGIANATNKRIVMWQIPLGNTKMRAVNNTDGHYQDNRTEWLFDEAARTHLAAYRDAGVVAFLFGGGASGTTCACNGKNDGVTNPAPINGNTMMSQAAAAGTAPSLAGGTLTTPYAADDDGGYFRWRAYRYYQDGPMSFSGSTAPVPTPPTNLRVIQ